jgi:hypothetical protein
MQRGPPERAALRASLGPHLGHLPEPDLARLIDFLLGKGIRRPEEFEHLHPDSFTGVALPLNLKSALLKFAKAKYQPRFRLDDRVAVR